jgi:hypothetical protein
MSTFPLNQGNVHIIRTQFFEIFDPPSFVTQNRTNPYMFTVERNKSRKCVRIMWTFPNEVLNLLCEHPKSEEKTGTRNTWIILIDLEKQKNDLN